MDLQNDALNYFLDSGGYIEIEGNEGYAYLECLYSQDVKTTSPKTITLLAN